MNAADENQDQRVGQADHKVTDGRTEHADHEEYRPPAVSIGQPSEDRRKEELHQRIGRETRNPISSGVALKGGVSA